MENTLAIMRLSNIYLYMNKIEWWAVGRFVWCKFSFVYTYFSKVYIMNMYNKHNKRIFIL